MKPTTKVEFIYWGKVHGHKYDDHMYDYEKYKGNDYKVRKRRYHKAVRRAGKQIIKEENEE